MDILTTIYIERPLAPNHPDNTSGEEYAEVEVAVFGGYTPGEDRVINYGDGSGYPGSEASVELYDASATIPVSMLGGFPSERDIDESGLTPDELDSAQNALWDAVEC